MWYRAIGSRNTLTVPSTFAAATHVRSIGPRRPAAPATRSTSPGCRAGRPPRCRCGSARRSPSGSRSPATRTTIPLRYCALGEEPAASTPRRGAGPRRCGGTRGTGSRGSGEARDRSAERQPEDRRLVEERVEDPRATELVMQSARHAVDTALHGDVLAEHERLGVPLEHVAERSVDRLGERQPLGCRLAPPPCQRGRPRRAVARRERPHHVLGGRQLRPSGRFAARARGPTRASRGTRRRDPRRCDSPPPTSHRRSARSGSRA